MKLQQFIEENSVSEFNYFELEKTNPDDFEKLNDFEIYYLKNEFNIYKHKYMNKNDEIHTYIFSNHFLYIKVIEFPATKEKIIEFYSDYGVVEKRITYIFDIKKSMSKYDDYGKEKLYINFSNFTGYKIKFPSKIYILDEESSSSEKIKSELSLRDIEEYL